MKVKWVNVAWFSIIAAIVLAYVVIAIRAGQEQALMERLTAVCDYEGGVVEGDVCFKYNEDKTNATVIARKDDFK